MLSFLVIKLLHGSSRGYEGYIQTRQVHNALQRERKSCKWTWWTNVAKSNQVHISNVLEISHCNKGDICFVCTTTKWLKYIHDPPVWFSVLSTQAVRELPAIKYAKRLGNQVLSSLPYLEASCRWFNKDIKLVCPLEDMTNDEETRPYLEIVSLRDHVLIASSLFTYPGIFLSLLYLEKCWWQSWKTVQSRGYAFPQPPSGVDWKPK